MPHYKCNGKEKKKATSIQPMKNAFLLMLEGI